MSPRVHGRVARGARNGRVQLAFPRLNGVQRVNVLGGTLGCRGARAGEGCGVVYKFEVVSALMSLVVGVSG